MVVETRGELSCIGIDPNQSIPLRSTNPFAGDEVAVPYRANFMPVDDGRIAVTGALEENQPLLLVLMDLKADDFVVAEGLTFLAVENPVKNPRVFHRQFELINPAHKTNSCPTCL